MEVHKHPSQAIRDLPSFKSWPGFTIHIKHQTAAGDDHCVYKQTAPTVL